MEWQINQELELLDYALKVSLLLLPILELRGGILFGESIGGPIAGVVKDHYSGTGRMLGALGDAIIRETHDDGYLPTFWMNTREDWPNCMLGSAAALAELSSVNL